MSELLSEPRLLSPLNVLSPMQMVAIGCVADLVESPQIEIDTQKSSAFYVTPNADHSKAYYLIASLVASGDEEPVHGLAIFEPVIKDSFIHVGPHRESVNVYPVSGRTLRSQGAEGSSRLSNDTELIEFIDQYGVLGLSARVLRSRGSNLSRIVTIP